MADIDSLNIKLQANAQKANTAIDSLITKLDNLATSLGRVNGSELNTLSMNITNLSASMRAINDVGTASFSRLAKNIGKIAHVDSSALNAVASSLNSTASAFNQFTAVSENAAQIGEVAKNIAKLGNKSVQTAITNMPQLATSLTNLLTTLAGAPAVSNNVIQMTNALANLASQGSRVGSASRTIQRSLNGVQRSAQTTTRSTQSLAVMFGKLYANYFLIIRGTKRFVAAIKSTTDYIEAFNYYTVAFNKIGSEWGKDFERFGYDNATDYANSFSDRVSALLGKLSGLQVDVEGGLLTADGAKNLGLNIQEVTEFASQLASVTNSLGQTGETTTAVAKSMTMLAGDISSLFNIDYTSVATNIQSGLIGQSRALYKYGIDITNATLQTYAYNLGVEKSISEMTQMEKQQLRVLAILDQSKVSWGDLSNTINSPSNMIRQFNTNVKETGMVLGQIFIPVLQKAMPVVNGVTIAIKRMLVSFARLMGVKIDFDAFGQNGYQDTTDGLEDMADGYNDVAKAAKNAQKGVRGFDELNNISTGENKSSASAGTGDTIDLTDEIVKATEEYEKVWNDAFDKMENKAEVWADKITKALSPVKSIFKNFVAGDFFAAGQDTSSLVSGLFNWVADAIDNVPWFTIGRNVGKYLAGIDWTEVLKSAAKVLWEGFKGALEFYAGMFTAAPLETVVVSFMAMPGLLKAITASKFVTGVKKLWSNFKAFGTVVNNTALALSGDAAATATLATMFPNLSSKVTAVKTAFTNLATSIQNKGLWRGINDSITSLRNKLTGFQKGLIGVASTAIEFTVLKDAFNDLTVGSDNMLLSIGKIAGVSAAAAGAMYLAFGPAGIAIAGITGVVAAISGINSAMDEIKTTEIGNDIKDTLSNPGGTPISELADQYADMVGRISDSFSAVTEGSTQLDAADTNIRSTWQEIEKIETAMENGVISVEDGTAQLTTLFGNLAQTASDKFGTLEDTLLAAFGENGALSEVFHRLGISTEDTVATVITLNDKVNQRVEELTSELATMDPSNPNYAKYKEELASLLATTDGLTESLSLFDLQLSQIDYSQIVLDDGTIDADAFNRVLEQVVSSALNAQKGIEDAVNAVQTSLQQEYNSAITLGDEQSAEEIKSKMDALPDALKLLKEDVALNAKEFTDTIQNDLVGKTSEIIDNAQDTFQAKNLKGKIALGGYVDKYVEDTVSKYNEGIGNISSSIETSMSTLGISGAGWGKDASKKIYDSLFSYGLDEGDSEGAYEYSLNSNYKSIIDNAMSDMPGYAKKASEPLGKNSVDGYVQGITAKQPLLNKTINQSLTQGLEAGAKAIDSHSPSKKYAELGKFSVLGYNQGIEQNTQLTTSTVQKYASGIINTFHNATLGKFEPIGIQAMNGLINGLASMETTLYSKVDEIAANVATTMQKALDIHSPSRVMFELGAYTTEGFKDGMESLYEATQLSAKDFGFGVVEAVHPQQLYSDYMSSTPTVSPMASTTTQNYYNSNTSVDNVETNALLREQNQLLQRILAKEYGITKDDIGKASRDYARDYFRRTGRDAYTF